MFKNIFNKIIKPKNKKVESDDSYCYSEIIWNNYNNLMILISFTEDYFEQIIDIQDAINSCTLQGKIIYSSYEEETDRKDDNGDNIIIIHKKYYMLIGGSPKEWNKLYMNIHNLGNEVLSKISDEITNNCKASDFNQLIEDGILSEFNDNYVPDTDLITKNGSSYTNPELVLSKLPNGFTGRDVIKFIKVTSKDWVASAFETVNNVYRMPNSLFKNHDLYPMYTALIKDPTPDKLGMLLEPLYKQPDDDTIPGDIDDESLDEIFRVKYERFSAVADDNMQYEDIDEILYDEESENIEESDSNNAI